MPRHSISYQTGNYNVLIILVLISLMLQAFICYEFTDLNYLIKRGSEPKYFATNPYGVLTPLTPLTEPSLSSQAIAQFSSDVATKAFTYNYLNQKNVFADLRNNFTISGWQAFLDNIKKSQVVDLIAKNRLVLSAVVKSAPAIVEEGPSLGHYAWQVQIPLLVSFHSGEQVINHNYIVNLRIVRRSTLDSPIGIGVERFSYNYGNGSNAYF